MFRAVLDNPSPTRRMIYLGYSYKLDNACSVESIIWHLVVGRHFCILELVYNVLS